MRTGKALAVFLLMAFTLLLAACGTSSTAEPETDTDNGSSTGNEEIEVTEVHGTIEQLDKDLFRYTVNNPTDETIYYDFSSGQRFDFTLSNDKGEELHRDSSVNMYMQALGEETLQPDGKLEYEFVIPELELEAGVYELKAWLTPTDGAEYEAVTEFKVE